MRAILLLLGISIAIAAAGSADDLARGFQTPPASAKPWVFWLWEERATRDGITKDLEMLKARGVGGLLFGDGGPNQLSSAWRENFRHLTREAARLGFEFNANVANGFGTGGPWATHDMAAKMLVYSEVQFDGPRHVTKDLPVPQLREKYYRDVAVVAFRERDYRPVTPASVKASSTQGGYVGEWNFPPEHAADRDPETFWRAAAAPAREKPAWLDLEYSEPHQVSGLYLAPASGAGPRDCALQVSTGGGEFRTVLEFSLDRGQARQLAFPAVSAARFRLLVRSAWEPDVQLAEFWLLREGDVPYLRRGLKWWDFKSGNRSFWDYPKQGLAALSEEHPDDERDLRAAEVIDLTAKMDPAGRIAWDVPAGRWSVVRFGYTLQGTTPRSTAPGYELDLFKTSTADATFEHVADPMLQDAGSALTAVHLDSYEYGVSEHGQLPTWTEAFRQEFHKRRGYDLFPYLLVLARRIVESREISNRFLWDYRRTTADLYNAFYARFQDLAHQRKLEANSENGYGTYPFPHIDGLEAFATSDVPQGEFWTGTTIMSQFYPFCNSLRTAASAAHIYGKRKIQSEAFSTWLRPYEAYPGVMKRFGDQAFADGVQQFVIFASTNQTGDVPGAGLGGYEIINRHVTWQKQSRAFFDYLARCQYLLGQGRFVAGALYYYGEGATTFVPAKEFLKPALPRGHDFDGLNTDVLLNRLAVRSGGLVLPSGMSYRVLVLPEAPELSPRVLRKVKELIEAGATVLGSRPRRAPGLGGFPQSDAEVKKIADQMWGPGDTPSGERRLGEGRLVWGKPVAEILGPEDVEVRGATLDFTHRRAGSTEIYFVANAHDAAIDVQPAFRVSGKLPEIWDPVTGKTWEATDFRHTGGRTAVPMRFAPHQSFFVVFRKPAGEPGRKRPNFPTAARTLELKGPWSVRFDPKWGGPESVTFESLTGWTARPEEGIRFYSGTATYRKAFDVPPGWKRSGARIFLDLGELKHLAEVRVNGKDLGMLWTKPFRVDITEAVSTAANALEVDVVNLWTNRLIGDAGLPPALRLTKSDVIGRFKKGDTLVESGLLGPVRMELLERPAN